MFIKAKNGNVVEIDDLDLAKRAIKDGHEVFTSDPREKGAQKWEPKAGEPAEGSEGSEK